MRITYQLLQIQSSSPLEETKYIDLSRKDIVIIERLSICHQLCTLCLSGNNIKAIQNVDCCRQLWNLDISGNKLKSLCGLSRFPVLGSVCLGGNELEWQELQRISHMTILNLSLLGNSKLDSDPHYRQHVVDMLPNVWMLDGQLITAEERKEVEDFFNDSQSSSHPVRRKRFGSVFVPTSLKNLLVNGVFGEKTTHMMSRFPINYIHNTDMDKMRLSYLIDSTQDDMKLALDEMQSTDHTLRSVHLQSLFKHRAKEIEQCNMLLLLMLAALEYSIPSQVIQATLETAKLTTIGDVQCMDLFMLPINMVLDVASLLLSAATVDRLDRKEGGLYNRLYKSLCFTMESVQKKVKCAARKAEPAPKKHKPLADSKNHMTLRCLLASEVVHLMCLVPHFFDLLQTNEGLIKMTAIATKNSNVSEVIAEIVWKVQAKGGDVWEVYQDTASYLLQATSSNVSGRDKHHSVVQPTVHKTTSQLLHSTQPKVSPRLLRAMSAGSVKRQTSRRVSKSAHTTRGLKEPELGDMVIIGAERVSRIVALPESTTAVLQINAPLPSNQPDAYFYMDTKGLVWDRQFKYWTKDSLSADFSSSQLSDSCATLPTIASTVSMTESFSQSSTPEHVIHRISRPSSRPLSGISFRSDDLQTIPSQEELLEGHGERSPDNSTPRGVQSSHIRVDIGLTAPSSTSVLSENDHKSHVLQQYSLNQLATNDSTTLKVPCTRYNASDASMKLSPRSQALQDLRKSTFEAKKVPKDDAFTVPSPQLQFAELWEGYKSVPTTSLRHYKPHSCKINEFDRQSLQVEPHMAPTPVLTSTQTMPFPISSDTLISENVESCYRSPREKPVLYDAWTVAKPNMTTKHSILTSSRLMQKRQPKTLPITKQSSQYGGMKGSKKGSPGMYTILCSRQPEEKAYSGQQRMSAYNSHSRKVVNKYHYHHTKAIRI